MIKKLLLSALFVAALATPIATPSKDAAAGQCQRYAGFGQNPRESRAMDNALRALIDAMNLHDVTRRASEVEFFCERNVLMVTCTAEAVGCR